METKELKITIPEGYCIDESKSTFEKIVFKKIDNKPRSWEEYLKQYKDTDCFVLGYDTHFGYCVRLSTYREGYCTVPSKELAEAFRTMMQLMSLRQDWIHKWSIDNGMTDDWKPDWTNRKSNKWCIICVANIFNVYYYIEVAQPFSFPTEEIAIDFMNTFKDLLKIAKPLI